MNRIVLRVVLGLGLLGLLMIPVSRGIRSLAMTRRAVATYARLIASSNAQDLAAVRLLCSRHYLATHPLTLAREGGVVGLPRQIHPNYRVWVEGDEVWLCPANRVGKVDRFVLETNRWQYDGPVGVLQGDGRVLLIPDDSTPAQEAD